MGRPKNENKKETKDRLIAQGLAKMICGFFHYRRLCQVCHGGCWTQSPSFHYICHTCTTVKELNYGRGDQPFIRDHGE